MTLPKVRLAILTWARRNGILAENMLLEDDGDVAMVPFDAEAVEYFRTRKIVRVEADDSKKRITIFSRRPIALAKKKNLEKDFAEYYAVQRYRLVVDSSKPFKVDQAVQAYGRFDPVRYHKNTLCCGSSIGLGNLRNAGTLTALVRDSHGELCGLSCNHVVGGCSIAQPGTPIVSPGIQDVSVEHNRVKVLGDLILPAHMSQGLPSVTTTGSNRDVAYFSIINEKLVSSRQGTGPDSYDTPSTFAKAKVDMPVKKWGRSTSLTHGIISHVGTSRPEPIEYNITCYYGPMNSQVFKGTVYYDEVYEISPVGKPFSLGGDSGALVVTDDPKKPKIVGIVIAGERTQSLVLPLKPALAELNLGIVSGHNF